MSVRLGGTNERAVMITEWLGVVDAVTNAPSEGHRLSSPGHGIPRYPAMAGDASRHSPVMPPKGTFHAVA